MGLNTASQVISFARQLEEDGAEFYKSLAKRFPENSELLLGLAAENKKGFSRIERAYYGVISDAIEGTFTFDIETERYAFKYDDTKKASFKDTLSAALEMENMNSAFYSKAAEQSKSLLADVPRAFLTMVKLKEERREKLSILLKGGETP